MFIRDDDDYGDLNVDQIREKGLGTVANPSTIAGSGVITGTGINKDHGDSLASPPLPVAVSDVLNSPAPSRGTVAASSPKEDSPSHGSTDIPNVSGASPDAGPSPSPSPSPSSKRGGKSRLHHGKGKGKGKGTDTTNQLASLANDGQSVSQTDNQLEVT